ncbi:hypothetical protein E1301_Tti018814 [Triplophysa tibetana]|uniref:Uncharacterized protein n=1 Tax=Triplophysa tibetana TaxID=1572043 RepID=A0A5A9P754_9TELE|nr:hypothetical protein E1301_Tti018814 [Triplophysa tibetana]
MLSESPRRRVASDEGRPPVAARGSGETVAAVALGKRKCTVRPPSKLRWNGDLCCRAPGLMSGTGHFKPFSYCQESFQPEDKTVTVVMGQDTKPITGRNHGDDKILFGKHHWLSNSH